MRNKFLTPEILERIKSDQIVPYTLSVEVLINDDNIKRFSLPNNETLRDKIIIGLFVRGQNTAGNRVSKSGYTLISNSSLACAHLTLEQNNMRFLNEFPLDFLLFENRQGKYFELITCGFDPTNSYVAFSASDSASRLVNQEVVELNFVYIDPQDYKD